MRPPLVLFIATMCFIAEMTAKMIVTGDAKDKRALLESPVRDGNLHVGCKQSRIDKNPFTTPIQSTTQKYRATCLWFKNSQIERKKIQLRGSLTGVTYFSVFHSSTQWFKKGESLGPMDGTLDMSFPTQISLLL